MVTLNLTVNHGTHDSAAWHGITFFTSADTAVTTADQHGCDSVATLHLSLHYSRHTDSTAMACDSLEWHHTTLFNDTILSFSGLTTEGCDSTMRLRVMIASAPEADMTVSPETLSDRQLTLTATDASRRAQWVQWNINGRYYGTEPAVTYTADPRSDSVRITLTAFHDHCTDTAVRIVHIIHEDLLVPNIFMPGSQDNRVNQFRIHGHGISQFEIILFNRQGATVYHSTDISQCWDGTRNGIPCPQGAYIYIINYRSASRTTPQQLKGSVILVR